MHPYLILLLLPLIGIIVFWLLPLPWNVVAYLIILLISGLLYWVIARAMRKVPEAGLEELVGAEAIVASKLSPHDEARYMVRVQGELWSADSEDELEPGEKVKILSVDGLVLTVGKIIRPSSS